MSKQKFIIIGTAGLIACGVAAIGLFALVVIIVMERSRASRDLNGSEALRLIQNDFGGEAIPAVISPVSARVDSSWDSGASWALYKVPRDQIDPIKQKIINHYSQQPKEMAIKINDSDSSPDGVPSEALRKTSAPDWWKPQDLPDHDVLAVVRPGSRTFWIFCRDHELVFFHQEQ
ncbi:MAG TPA: hypothetical protein VHD56_11605 [Tepidisphaeraceae bacterium]|nr:hypothetical protein [Tepidisphaeraceae bacterium]